jgi:hypothetical protein
MPDDVKVEGWLLIVEDRCEDGGVYARLSALDRIDLEGLAAEAIDRGFSAEIVRRTPATKAG